MVPLIEPLFFPFASSRITPTHFPTTKYHYYRYCEISAEKTTKMIECIFIFTCKCRDTNISNNATNFLLSDFNFLAHFEVLVPHYLILIVIDIKLSLMYNVYQFTSFAKLFSHLQQSHHLFAVVIIYFFHLFRYFYEYQLLNALEIFFFAFFFKIKTCRVAYVCTLA